MKDLGKALLFIVSFTNDDIFYEIYLELMEMTKNYISDLTKKGKNGEQYYLQITFI